jgi:CBS domain-containing protein
VGVLEEGALAGLVTESDLVSASLVREASHDTAIRVAMRSIPMVDADCSVDSCQATMRDHHTRHLLVEEGGVIVGIITMRHILRLMLEEQRWAAQHLEEYITGGHAALRGA